MSGKGHELHILYGWWPLAAGNDIISKLGVSTSKSSSRNCCLLSGVPFWWFIYLQIRQMTSEPLRISRFLCFRERAANKNERDKYEHRSPRWE